MTFSSLTMIIRGLCLLLLPFVIQAQYCPLEETIAPSCICRDTYDGPMMQCNNIMSPEELIPPIKATDGVDIFALAIMDSSLLYLPNGIFKNTKIKKIMFVNTQLMSLSESDIAFEGLETHLEEIRATGVTYITQWDWSQIRKLQKLTLLDVHSISMYAIDHEFPALKSLKILGINKAEISFIHPNVFQELPSLSMLIMRDNDISEMSRSMLPNPALHLFMLDLSGNKLSTLPKDMFQGMPSLEEVNLSNNKFVTLDEPTFLQPMQQLKVLNFKGNKLSCDCRLRWTVNIKKPSELHGECDTPASLKGSKINYLPNNVLWC